MITQVVFNVDSALKDKAMKKAKKAGLADEGVTAQSEKTRRAAKKSEVAQGLFYIAQYCQDKGWSAEELLRQEIARRERAWRKAERQAASKPVSTNGTAVDGLMRARTN